MTKLSIPPTRDVLVVRAEESVCCSTLSSEETMWSVSWLTIWIPSPDSFYEEGREGGREGEELSTSCIE